jgi:3-deoxy-manno-octulosonate cytidylyltransferase (CMP-KDO synthetase)
MRSVIVIPARYASVRLPGKPLLQIAGKPLIQWVYERARASTLADDVVIATDDERIRAACEAFGAPVAMTGSECRSGTDRVQEALRGKEADIVVNLQGDEPQIEPAIIDGLIRAMREDKEIPMATLCSLITDPDEYKNPHVVKVVRDSSGMALYFSRAPLPFLQKAVPMPLYKHIGVYAFSRSFLDTFVSLPKGRLEEAESLEQLRALEAGYRIKTLLVEYHGIGIDTVEDLEQARKVMSAQAS